MKNLVKLSIPLMLFASWMPLQAPAQVNPIVGSYYVPSGGPGSQQLESLFTYKADGTLEVSSLFGNQRDLSVNTYEVEGNTLRLGSSHPKQVSTCPQTLTNDQPEKVEEYKFKITEGGTLVVDMDFFKVPFGKATPEQIAKFESMPLCK